MALLSCTAKTTDVELAEKIEELYADGLDKLSDQDCSILNLKEGECAESRQVIETGKGGTINVDGMLIKIDGKKAIENRAKWLVENAVTHWYGSRALTDRGNMVVELGNIGLDSDEVFEALVELSKDENKVMREFAIEALGKIGTQRTVPVLMGALQDPAKYVRYAAAELLGRGEAVPVLKEMIKEKVKELRYSAAEKLGGIGDEEAIPVLAEMIRDGDVNRVHSALQILDRKFRGKKIIPVVAEAFAVDNRNVQTRAIGILGDIGGEDTIPAFMEAFKSPNSGMRGEVVHELRKFGSKAIDVLATALNTPDKTLRRHIIDAFIKLNSKEATPVLIKIALHDDSGEVRFAAVEALRFIGDENAAPALVQLLGDPVKRVCYEAASALGDLGRKEAIPTLLEMLREFSSGGLCEGKYKELKCYGTSMRLGKIGKEAVPELEKLIKDPYVVLRRFAADALGRIGGEEARPALLKALKDPDEKVRFWAIRNMFNSRNEEDIPVLKKALKDKAELVRSTADQTLKRIAEKNRK